MTDGAIVGVLALQGAFREHRRILESLGVRTELVRSPVELAGVDALVIPGGESTAMSRLALDLDLLHPVTDRIAEGMPAFGTCAGMIMLAERVLDGRPDQRQFGGLDLTVRRNAFGRQVESFELGVAIPAIGDPAYPGVFIRSPWVESAGTGVEVLARIERGGAGSAEFPGKTGPGSRDATSAEVPPRPDPASRDATSAADRGSAAPASAVRIVAVRQGHVLATSFHPELTADRRLHQLFLSMLS